MLPHHVTLDAMTESPQPRLRIAFILQDFHIGGMESWLYRVATQLGNRYDFHFVATHVPDILPPAKRAEPGERTLPKPAPATLAQDIERTSPRASSLCKKPNANDRTTSTE